MNYNHTAIDNINALPAAVTAPGTFAAALGQAPGARILNAAAISALTSEIPEEKVILQALWSRDRWSVNARTTIYGETSVHDILTATGQPFTETIPITAIFDLDVAHKLTNNVKIDVGANNLFGTLPPKTPNIDGAPASNSNIVFGVPIGASQGGFAPFGATGGYYYGPVTVTF